MLRDMERSTSYYLKQKGWTNVQIAEFTGHHRDTIARLLREDVEKKPKTRTRSSAVAFFEAQIAEWLYNLEGRLVKAVSYVNEHGFITNKIYRNLTGVSERTARRDLEVLEERGRLKALGKRRARRYE